MTIGPHEVPPIASVTELIGVAKEMEGRAAARYRELAATMAAAGNTEAAGALQRLAAERQSRATDLAQRGAELGLRSAAIAPAAPTGLEAPADELADEDPYTVTAYRILRSAVHDEERAFAFHAYVAAHTPDEQARQLAESLAREHLGHAASRRRERRSAWHQARNGACSTPPLPRTPGAFRALATDVEHGMAIRHQTLAQAAAALGDAASAKALRAVAATAEASTPTEGRPEPPGKLALPMPAGSFELLRACLVDLDRAYDLYMRVAEGRAEEGMVRDAQRLAESSIQRRAVIRDRLAALGEVSEV